MIEAFFVTEVYLGDILSGLSDAVSSNLADGSLIILTQPIGFLLTFDILRESAAFLSYSARSAADDGTWHVLNEDNA